MSNVHIKNLPEISVTKLQSFHCDICACIALNESTLSDHVIAAHGPSKPWSSIQCGLCLFVALLKNHLKRHIAVPHASIRCAECPVFRMIRLQVHLLMTHCYQNFATSLTYSFCSHTSYCLSVQPSPDRPSDPSWFPASLMIVDMITLIVFCVVNLTFPTRPPAWCT